MSDKPYTTTQLLGDIRQIVREEILPLLPKLPDVEAEISDEGTEEVRLWLSKQSKTVLRGKEILVGMGNPNPSTHELRKLAVSMRHLGWNWSKDSEGMIYSWPDSWGGASPIQIYRTLDGWVETQPRQVSIDRDAYDKIAGMSEAALTGDLDTTFLDHFAKKGLTIHRGPKPGVQHIILIRRHLKP